MSFMSAIKLLTAPPNAFIALLFCSLHQGLSTLDVDVIIVFMAFYYMVFLLLRLLCAAYIGEKGLTNLL